MTVTVVGSIAFDAVETPAGKRDRLLGGAAVHFALASSFLAETRVVGPVGDDFGEQEYAVLRARGVVTDDIEHVPGGKTFFWAGRYAHDVNQRETLQTDLNVFEHFEPKLSDASRSADTLFLANIQPDLQRAVREQCPDARFTAMDSMNLWIDIARDSLVRTIGTVDCVSFNDSELKMLTGEPNLPRAARAVQALGPRIVVAKQGEYGAVDVHPGGLLRAARPTRRPTSWTRPAPGTPSRAASWATSPPTPARSSPTGCCAARWPTGRRWPPSTSRRSGPSGCRRSPRARSPTAWPSSSARRASTRAGGAARLSALGTPVPAAGGMATGSRRDRGRHPRRRAASTRSGSGAGGGRRAPLPCDPHESAAAIIAWRVGVTASRRGRCAAPQQG